MERELQKLLRQLDDLKKDNQKTKAAANFLFHSIVEVLDEQSDDVKFSETLKQNILTKLDKITMGGTKPQYMHAINELMQPPIKQMFSNQTPEKFLK